MKVNLLADLESYRQYDNQNRGEKLYSELKSIADKMTKNELKMAQSYYEKVSDLDIKGMGVLSNIELALKLTRWLYPRVVAAYQDSRKQATNVN